MRGLPTELTRPLIVIAAFAAITSGGCTSSGPPDDATVKAGTGTMTDLRGKPQTPADSAYAGEMQKTGNAMNADMMKGAAAMKAAKDRTGGK